MNELSAEQVGEIVEENSANDIENRIFARMCQLLSKHNNVLGIRFKTLEKMESKYPLETYKKKCKEMNLTNDYLINKMRFLNMIEDATNNNVTDVRSVLTGDIMHDLCKNKVIRIEDDLVNIRIVIKLLESRPVNIKN